MLAPEDEARALNALRFSVAGDIVELVVLTGDESFLQTLREAVGASRRLWHVPSADKVSDLLVAGGVGILVLDAQVLQETAQLFIKEIKRQFPDLVVLVAGSRDAETALARLISDGSIYRFIHKPLSPGRARLFAEAAVRKYDEQRKRSGGRPMAAIAARPNRGLLIGAGCAALCVIFGVFALLHHRAPEKKAARQTIDLPAAPAEAPLLARAAQALAANRLTAPSGDNALELYQLAIARNPADADARAGLAEVHERLLARAENALLEERLDEAAAAIDAASEAGVDSARIAFLSAQLAKARQPHKGPSATDRVRESSTPADAHPAPVPARSAVPAVPVVPAVPAPAAITARADSDHPRPSPGAARRQVDADASNRLLQSAQERLQQDRLIEPADDSAQHYLSALRSVDPENSALPALMQDLGARMVAKAERALTLKQYGAARGWLAEATAVGYSSPDSAAALSALEKTLAEQQLLATVVNASELTLIKSAQTVYPRRAEQAGIEGWVEVEFTVAETGEVKDIAVTAAKPPGIFEQAAIGALSKWRYRPVLRDEKPVAQRARIRIRFTLAQ